MQLTHPFALLWLLLGLPLIALYLLKVRRRRVPVSTIIFWNQVFGQRRPRALWQRLRHPLSLLLQLVLLGLLALALADPLLIRQSLRSRRIVMVLDNSASMQATDVTPDRWSWARRQARRVIQDLRPRDQLAIISAASTPRVEIGLTDHTRSLLQALDRLQVTDGPTQVAEAVQLAQRLLQDHPQPQILVIGDRHGAAGSPTSRDVPVEWITCGTRVGNTAITRWQARRSLIDPLGLHALIEVCNFSDQPVSCRLNVSLNDQLLDVVPLRLQPDQAWQQVLDFAALDGGPLTAQLELHDALACDNRAVALVPACTPQAVTLVTPGNVFLESALRSIPGVELTVTHSWPQEVSPGTILIGHKTAPSDAAATRQLFVIEPPDDDSLGQFGEPLGDTLVVAQSSSSVLMSHVQLQNVPVPGVRQLRLSDDYQVLAEAPGGVPVFAARTRSEGKTLIWNASLDEGELPLRTAFPILMSNAIQWFQGNPGRWLEAYPTGAQVTIAAPAPETRSASEGLGSTPRTDPGPTGARDSPARQPSSATRCMLVRPDGQTQPLTSTATDWSIGPLDQSGIWRIERDDPAAGRSQAGPPSGVTLAEIACNLACPPESDLRVDATAEHAVTIGGPGGWPLWCYFTLVGLALTAIEWFLYQRRWIG